MKKLDINELEVIAKYKNGESCDKIAQLFSIHKSSVRRILIKNGTPLRDYSLSHRSYHMNENYFDMIDSEEKAYILGILFADGHNNFPSSNGIEISLEKEDKYILDKIQDEIYTFEKPPMYEVPGKHVRFGNKSYLSKPQNKITIYSKHMAETLHNLGMEHNKSKTLIFPLLPEASIRHFIRGYFDGDGSFSILKKSEQGMFRVIGSESFCKTLSQILSDKCSANSNVLKRKHSDIYDVVSCGNKQVRRVFEWLYSDCEIKLERKFLKVSSHYGII